jgi:hypothetical protein
MRVQGAESVSGFGVGVLECGKEIRIKNREGGTGSK